MCPLSLSHRAQAIVYTRASLCKPHQNINKTYPSATHYQRQHLTPCNEFHLFWPPLHTRLTPHPTYTPLLLKTVTHSWSVNTPVDPKAPPTKEHIFRLLQSGHWEERQQGGVIGPLVEADLKTQSWASVLPFTKCCYHSCNCIDLSHRSAPLWTVSQGLHLYSLLVHTPLTFTIQVALKQCYKE